MKDARRNRKLAVAIVLGAIVCLLLVFLVALAPTETPPPPSAAPQTVIESEEAGGTRQRVHGNTAGTSTEGARGTDAKEDGVDEDEPLPRICRLDVRVLSDAHGLPLAGAAVTYRDTADSTWDAVADDDGLAVMRDVSWSSGRVRVTAPGHAAAERHVVGIPLGGRLALAMRLQPELPLRVVVRNGWSGAPVSAARVRVFDFESGDWLPEEDPGPVLVAAETNESGEAYLSGVPAGACMIQVSRDGTETTFTGLRRNPDHDDTTVVTLWTSPSGSVFGRVLDEQGAPVAGAHVRVSWGRSGAFQPVFRIAGENVVLRGPAGATTTEIPRPLSTKSDEEGRYRIDGVRRGPTFFVHALNVVHTRFLGGKPQRLGRESEDLELDLVALEDRFDSLVDDGAFEFPDIEPNIGDATITGRVVDEDGRGLGDARVWIAGETQATYSEPDGHFEIRGVPAGDCTVRAGRKPYTRVSLDTTAPGDGLVLAVSKLAGEEADRAPAMPEVIRFTAILRGDGPPPPALTVLGSFGLTTTRWSGRERRKAFRVSLPKSRGATALRSVQITGAGVRPTMAHFPPERAPELDLGDVVLDTGGVVRGVVVDDTGIPAEGVTVNVLKPGGAFVSSTFTGRDGRFVAGGLTAGRHQLATGSEKHVFTTVDLDVDDNDAEVRIVVRRLVRVRVLVHDPEGLPIFEARIRADALEGVDVTTDRSGAAEIWLPPGRHSVGAYEPSTAQLATPQVVELELGNASTEVILVLTRTAKVRLR